MRFGIGVERRKHDWENDLRVVGNEAHYIFVVPVIQRPFCDLEMRRGDTARKLFEKGLSHLVRAKVRKKKLMTTG